MFRNFPFPLLCILSLLFLFIPPSAVKGDDGKPSGAEIYGRFMDTLESMDSLKLESTLLWKSGERTLSDGEVIRYYLKKPDTYRCEVIQPNGDLTGLLVCDGDYCWSTWPKGTTLFTQHKGIYKNEIEVYMKEAAYRGKSVFHQLSLLGALPVFNANAFFGGKESLDPYLDGIEYLGEEKCEGEPCHKVKVSYMKGQRVRTVWISKKDHIPRKWLGELLLANSQSTREIWTGIEQNPGLDDTLFQWIPPEGYEARKLPSLEERLLQVGDEAAPFRLKDGAGKILDTKDYKGKIIWLMFWRIG